MSKRAGLFWIAAVALAVIGYFSAVYVYENRLYSPFISWMSPEFRESIKRSVLIFQYAEELEAQVEERDRRLAQLEDVQEFAEEAVRTHPGLPEYLPFTLVGTETFKAGPNAFELTSYESSLIPLNYFGRRAYLEQIGDDLILVTGKGTVGRMPLADIAGDSFEMKTVPTNLQELISYPEFYEVSEFSIKDILRIGDDLLLTYSKEAEPDCYTTAIAAAGLTRDRLDFHDIFVPDECIPEDNDYGEFSANQSGGRMVDLGEGHILLSTGDWRVRDLAQDPASFFGKILDVDLDSGEFRLVSMGHRNPQGLYHDAEVDVVIISEHGPEGGDEINVNRTPDGEPENFGWPISSYGEHYQAKQSFYDKAPLYKSHAEHGFIEPERHWESSLSPSQLVRLQVPGQGENRYALMMGALGTNYHEGDESLHIFDFDSDFRITEDRKIIVNDRIRDIIPLPGPGRYALFLEGDFYEFGTIGLLSVAEDE